MANFACRAAACLSMLHTYLPVPFSRVSRQQQFDALQTALQGETGAPTTLLLGNLPVGGATLDAVVVRPHSIVLLLLLPGGGPLHIPDFGYGAWRLAGQPLTGAGEADNPWQQFSQQKELLAAWLRPHLPPDAANLNFIAGLALFEDVVTLGPEVEERMSAVPASSSFHLLPDPANCTRRLRQLATPEIDLTPADILQLAAELTATQTPPPAAAPTAATAATPADTPELLPAQLAESDAYTAAAPASAPSAEATQLRRAAGKLWRWLGAEDVLDDTPDLSADTYAAEAPQQQKEELERLRADMQAELGEQLRALEAREKEREASITQLRQQLTTAAPVTPEAQALQARLAAESQEKERLDAALRASRADLEQRNQEMDARIGQLEGLIRQLQQAPPPVTTPASPQPAVAPVLSHPLPGAAPSSPSSAPAARLNWPQARQQWRQWRRYKKRALLAGGGVLGTGLLWWGLRAVTAGPPVPFQEQGRWGYLTAHQDTLVPARYSSAGSFQEDRAVVEKDGAFGFIDLEGTETVPPAYDGLLPYSGGYARARIGKLYTFLDLQGQEFTSYYYAAQPFSEGRAAVLDRRGWFYITGPEELTEPPVIFQEAYPFRQGLARVKRAGAFTFITEDFLTDTTDTAPFGRYDNAADFVDGRARVTQQGRTFYIDTDADEVK